MIEISKISVRSRSVEIWRWGSDSLQRNNEGKRTVCVFSHCESVSLWLLSQPLWLFSLTQKLAQTSASAEGFFFSVEWDNNIHYLSPRVELLSWQRVRAHYGHRLTDCQRVSKRLNYKLLFITGEWMFVELWFQMMLKLNDPCYDIITSSREQKEQRGVQGTWATADKRQGQPWYLQWPPPLTDDRGYSRSHLLKVREQPWLVETC